MHLNRYQLATLSVVMALIAVFGSGGQGCAQTIDQQQPLTFGTFALRNNNASHLLRVQRTGVVNADAAYVLFVPPERGQFILAGFPPSTELTFVFTNATLTLNGGGAGNSFTVQDFTPPASLTTNASGNATLRFGASLYTSGSGINYADGNYSGDSQLTINY